MTTETRERISDPERLSRLEGAYGHLATKADIAALETRLTEKIVESEIRTAEKIAASEIRTAEKIAASETRMVKWAVGIAISVVAALTGLIAAALTLLYRLLS